MVSFFEDQVTVASGHDSMFLHFSALDLPSFLGRSVISREFKRLMCDIRCRTSLWNGGFKKLSPLMHQHLTLILLRANC